MKLLVIVSCFLFVGLCSCDPVLTGFYDTYYIEGSLKLPYASLDEPFKVWYTADNSRIEYYNGTVTTYQLGTDGDYGTMYEIVPETTDDAHMNVMSCFQSTGTSDSTVTAQTIFPDVSLFNYTSTSTIDNVTVHNFEYSYTILDKKNTYILSVTTEGVPVKYEMFGRNNIISSHSDHYIIDYDPDTYTNGNDIDDFDSYLVAPTSDYACSGFPGPGDEAKYQMNPMAEYINGDAARMEQLFEEFKQNHGRNYKDDHEESERMATFRSNVRYIYSKNRAGLKYKLAINQFVDRTSSEVAVLFGRKSSSQLSSQSATASSSVPQQAYGLTFTYTDQQVTDAGDYLDWRQEGAVTRVKDQATCGSCWSFGSTGSIEGSYFLQTGNLVEFSQQALMDCSWGYGNNGCDGGEDWRVYDWMIKHGGVPTTDSYGPYLGQDGYCHYEDSTLLAAISNYTLINDGDVNGLKVALHLKGPISVSIDASPQSFLYYSSGIFYDETCKNGEDDLDHSVLAVGYGKDQSTGEEYWIVRNSWSTHWGDHGYVKMSTRNNNCGVATAASFVNLKAGAVASNTVSLYLPLQLTAILYCFVKFISKL